MILSFKIGYQTFGGDLMLLGGSSPILGEWNPENALPMKGNESGEWEADIQGKFSSDFEYKYLIKNNEGYTWEWGKPRKLNIDEEKFEEVRARDFWRPHRDPEIPLYSSAFTRALMHRNSISRNENIDLPQKNASYSDRCSAHKC